jgi:hypothetical protein
VVTTRKPAAKKVTTATSEKAATTRKPAAKKAIPQKKAAEAALPQFSITFNPPPGQATSGAKGKGKGKNAPGGGAFTVTWG